MTTLGARSSRRQNAAHHRGIVVAAKYPGHEHDPRARLVQHVQHFGVAVDGDDGIQHHPHHRGCEVDDTGLPPIRQLERHDFAWLQADREEPAGEPACAPVELRARELERAVNEQYPVRGGGRARLRQLSHGLVGPVLARSPFGHGPVPPDLPAAGIFAQLHLWHGYRRYRARPAGVSSGGDNAPTLDDTSAGGTSSRALPSRFRALGAASCRTNACSCGRAPRIRCTPGARPPGSEESRAGSDNGPPHRAARRP